MIPIMSMIAVAAQGTMGIAQTIKGLTMPKPDVPDYDIPQEIFDNMTDAEYWSYKGLPEAQKQQFIENSMRAGATAISRSTDRKGGLGMISSIAQQERDSARDLLSMDAQARMSNVDRLLQARRELASAKNTEQEWNMQKILDERAKRDEMIGAGIQNIGQSFSTFAGGAGGGAGKLFGNTQTKRTPTQSFGFTQQSAPTLNMPSMPTSLKKI